MACACMKNKQKPIKVVKKTPQKATRPLSQGGRTRRMQKRIIK